MVNKEFIFIDSSFNQTYDINENKKISLFGILKKENEINLNFNINKPVKLDLNFTYLILEYSNINVNINIKHNVSYSKSIVKTNIIASGQSSAKNILNTLVDKNINNVKANQEIVGILLENSARIVGQPNLEINTDNILATHSLNIGNLNKEELFYLNIKGFNEKQAKKILLQSIIDNCLSIADDQQQIKINKMIENHL